MPYIKQAERKIFDDILDQISNIETKGQLEYCIYKLLNIYMKDKKVCYSTLHDTVYAAHHCGDEFRRNHLDKREDQAKLENGDVF